MSNIKRRAARNALFLGRLFSVPIVWQNRGQMIRAPSVPLPATASASRGVAS